MTDELPNVMVDLETLGTGNDSAIVSIGAVKFRPSAEPGTFDDEFSTNVDIASALGRGATVDGSTIKWWLEQSDEARLAFLRDTKPLPLALFEFAGWFGPASLPTWGNGASFDCVILASAFRRCNQVVPWRFNDERCFRTIRTFFPGVPRVAPTVVHRALDDAKAQAQHLQAIYGAYGNRP